MNLRKNLALGLAVSGLLALPLAASAATINEIRIDHSGADTDEYFELAGSPGENLDGLFYIVIGDGSAGSGVLESITDLSGFSIQADGYFSAHNSGTTATQTCGSYDAEVSLAFENSDNVTHMLVTGLTGSLQDDLDTDDDGVLDVTPWTSIVDSVALLETDPNVEGDQVYSGTTVGPDGSFVPAHVYMCNGVWEIGDFTLCTNDTPGDANCDPVATESESFGAMKSKF